jgi:subtilisin family serine protease
LAKYIVGVIDTGIDFSHPAFGKCTPGKYDEDGCIIKYGYDIIDNDTDPSDTCDGHGTHVAGIIAGNDPAYNFTGVAPGVSLGVYRVFRCKGESTATENILAALDKASKDKMDIINMSLSNTDGSPNDPVAIAINELSRNGVICVAAMGNEGKNGIWYAGTPALADYSTTVGSVYNLQAPALEITIDGLKTDSPFSFSIFDIP